MRLYFSLLASVVIFAAPPANKRVPSPQGQAFAQAIEDASKVDTIASGATGPRVVRAQILLDRARFSPGEIDGVYGEDMKTAIRGFQDSRQLPLTGTVDAATW